MAFRSSTGFAQGSGNSLAIDVPTGAAVDDIAVVGIYKENDRAVTPPAGFTQKTVLDTSATAQGSLYVFWKRLTAADTGTYSFSWGGPGTWRSAACALLSGRTTTGDPFDGTVGTAESGAEVSTLNVSTSPANADGDAVDFHTDFQGGNSWTPPTNYTERQDLDVIGMFTRDAVASGSTGSVTPTANVSGFMKAFIGVLQAAAAGGVVTGTASGSYGFTGTAAGTRRTSGTAAGSYGFSGTASGVRTTSGTATGSYGFTGLANGIRRVLGAVAGAFGFTGTASGTRRIHGTATGNYGFTGAAVGVVGGVVTGTAQGSYGFAGTAAGVRHAFGTATGTYGFTGTASGVIGGVVTGDAMGSYGFTGTATGTVTGPTIVTGTATGTYGYAGVVVGVRTALGTASGTYGFAGTVVVDTGDPNPMDTTFREPPSRGTYREQSSIVYQEA